MLMKIQHREKLDTQFRHLSQGEQYSVQREFSDYDGIAHPVGEVWEFIGSNFVPYHDGLSLFAKINGEEQQIRLQGSPGEQATVIEDLNEYLVPCA
ncbi:DUF3601 domain-containing protein [Marinobacter sp. KM021]|uniref:DUF3601 domain-containing protein n=2 Tax=Marinobacter TaxID=2742 RepID=UPI003D6A38F7